MGNSVEKDIMPLRERGAQSGNGHSGLNTVTKYKFCNGIYNNICEISYSLERSSIA